jgi:hypothetical protein
MTIVLSRIGRRRSFDLRYERERWQRVALTDVKDYQKAAA